MSCVKPLPAYYGKVVGPSGKRRLTFTRSAAFSPIVVPLPCGQCMGCRLEKSRQWAMRCVHESQLWDTNIFLTLTYDDVHMPVGRSLSRRDPQLFLKRLRERYGTGIRFYGCGEYGPQTLRPHYHLLLFNFRFPDQKPYDKKYFASKECEELWPYGRNVIGNVDWESCAYVARYIASKVTGERSEAYYNGRLPEFAMMSRRPGIGTGWFQKFGDHTYELDNVVINGRLVKPPKFYDNKYELIDAKALAVIKRERRRRINRSDNTPDRRNVKEQVLALNMKKRDLC